MNNVTESNIQLDHVVADISLAEFGRKEYQLQKRNARSDGHS